MLDKKLTLLDRVVNVVAFLFALLVLGYAAGVLPPLLFEFQILCLICLLIIGYGPEIQKAYKEKRHLLFSWNLMVFFFGLISCLYIIPEIPRIRVNYGMTPPLGDVVFGTLLLISILELTRKRFGMALPIIFFVFLLYALWGNLLPVEFFGHRGFSYPRVMSYAFGPAGIFGFIMSIFVRIIALFLIFGTLIHYSGMAEFLIDLANGMAGRWRGGPAKVAILASAFLGTIQGTSVTNVATTGSVTIPLMKRCGYQPSFAGAVEAAASVGGLLLPPIMGASAFLMAEFLSIPYRDVAIAATIPALLYFIGVYLMVDLEAVKRHLVGIKDTPPVKILLKKGFYHI